MPATTVKLPRHVRQACLCGKPATVDVLNRFRVSQGRWCTACAATYVQALDAKDEPPPPRRSK